MTLSTEDKFPILRYFRYKHLPKELQGVSKLCRDLAYKAAFSATRDLDERMAGLRKLLEAKDCFVRASLKDEHAEERDEVLFQKKSPILRHFAPLLEDSNNVVEACRDLAHKAWSTCDHDPRERAAGLRKLLEAMDCFVRADLSFRDNP